MVVTGEPSVAPDLVHDVFFELQRHADRIRDPERWLLRATINRSRSWLRSQATARRYLPSVLPGTTRDAVDADTLAVRDALAGLSDDHRAALFLRFYLDLSEAEMARVLGCRPGTVKSRLRRGLDRLREALDEQG